MENVVILIFWYMEGYSIDNQIDSLTKKIEYLMQEKKYEIIQYVDDGYSAEQMNRPEYVRLIEDVESGLVDQLFCWRLDRLNRNMFSAYGLITRLLELKIKVSTLMHQIKIDTPDDELKLLVQLLFDHIELLNIRYRTREAQKGAIRNGNYIYGGKPPYGYLRVGKTELIFNPDLKEKIDDAIDTYIKTPYSIQYVSVMHNIPYGTMTKILRNPIYRGILYADDVAFKVTNDIYINENIIDRINQKLSFWTSKAKHVYLFKKKLVCNCCSRKLASVSTNKKGMIYYYYICLNSNCRSYKLRINEIIVENALNVILNNLYNNLTINEKNHYLYETQYSIDTALLIKKIRQLLAKNKAHESSIELSKKMLLSHQISYEEHEANCNKYNKKIKQNIKIINDAQSTFDYDKLIRSRIIYDKLSEVYIDLKNKKVIK